MSNGQIMFPFVKIVGQEDMKKALLLNIIDPGIGGVLIKGEKGTAKSTTVRSLEQILPRKNSVKGCVFHCDPTHPKRMCVYCREKLAKEETLENESIPMNVVELPLSATEDRISGTLDLEHVLKTGEKKFEAGVLAQANGNLLYVDEVNLLDDHIVDLLLDSAAMGMNYVEREGVSFSHPAKFVLVGTMNPEEGSIRPQLLDRFGLSVDIKGERDIETRMEVIRRRMAFDADPEGYTEACSKETEELRAKLKAAKDNVNNIKISNEIIHAVALVAIKFGMEGHRADIALIRVAKANAALAGRDEVTLDDIQETGGLVLTHRLKKGPFEEAVFKPEDLKRCLRGY